MIRAMEWEIVLPAVATGLATVFSAARPLFAARGRRNRIKHDLELLKLMPKGEAASRLEEDINQRVLKLIEDRSDKRRDPLGIATALIFIGLTIWTALLAFKGSNWWLAAAIPLGIFAVAGSMNELVPRRRDERGRIIRGDPPNS